MWWKSGAFSCWRVWWEKCLTKNVLRQFPCRHQFSRCSVHNNHYIIKIKIDIIKLISTFNGHIKLHCTGHGTQILWWSQTSGINPCSETRGMTVGQLLLYYDYMVQVEHNRTIQQGNICINMTEACLNTHCNYTYCTFNLI